MITLTFDGPAVEDGEIDVSDLAPALLGLTRLLELSNTRLNGGDARIAVRVKATRANCFSIDLSLIQTVMEQVRAMFSTMGVRDPAALLGFVMDAQGLLALFRQLVGKTITKATPAGDQVTLELADGSIHTISSERFAMLIQEETKKAIRQLVQPMLRADGDNITSMTVHRDGAQLLLLTREDAVAFGDDIILDEQIVTETKTKREFTIVRLDFREGNKWELNDGITTTFFQIRDRDFIAQVQGSALRFAKNDTLVCEVTMVQTRKNGKLYAQTFIDKVLDHIPYQSHPNLFEA